MDKRLILAELLYINNPDIENILNNYNKKSGKYITSSLFLDLISKNSYNMKHLGISTTAIANLLKRLFPDRENNNKPCTFLLKKYGYKWCSRCTQVYSLNNFRANSAISSGYNTYCIDCQNISTAKTQPYRQKKYQTAKLNRTPSWARLDIIKLIYDCAEGCHVDHIIPLQGDLVCGLHVENNLQYLSAHDNIVKSNTFIIE